jgi:hypothetical protein
MGSAQPADGVVNATAAAESIRALANRPTTFLMKSSSIASAQY